jgi:hypothetical protein
VPATWDAIRQFVAGREHQMAALETPAVRGLRRHAVAPGIYTDDLDRREDPGFAPRGGVEQPKGRLAWIDRKIAVPEQRRGARDAEALAQRLAIEQAAGKPGRAARIRSSRLPAR